MKRFNFLVIACILFIACETIVEVDVSRESPKLVANAFINPDSIISVRLSQSKYVLDNTPLSVVEGAQISIFENDHLKEVLQEKGQGLYTSSFRPLEGKAYTLRAEANDFETVESTTFIRPKVPIQSLQYQADKTEQSTACSIDSCWTMYSTKYTFNLTLKDPANETGYYEISGFLKDTDIYNQYDDFGNIIGQDTVVYLQPAYFNTEDPAVTDLEFAFEEGGYYGETLLFSDDIFAGKEYTIKFDLDSYVSENTKEVSIVLKTIDEARYRYLRSKELQNKNEGNPFAEPVNVYNNIEHGYGIFASYSADSYIFVVE